MAKAAAAKKPAEKKAEKVEEAKAFSKPNSKVHWDQDLNKHPKFDKFKTQGEK